MSLLDRIKSLFSGGDADAGVQHTPEPDAARALDDPPEVATPPTPAVDPVGMPTGEPQPAEPQAGQPQREDPADRAG